MVSVHWSGDRGHGSDPLGGSAQTVIDPAAFKNLDKEAKLRAIFDIDRRNDTRGVPVLLAALIDADTDVRKAAAGRLIFVHDKTCIQPLAKALKYPEPLVRRHALYALERLNGKAAVPDIILALKDPVMEVRYEAAITLGRIGGKPAVGPLTAALDDSSPVVQNEAIKSLGVVGDQKVLPKIFAAMRSDGWQTVDVWARTECLRGFAGALKNPAVVPMLKELLRDGTKVNVQGGVVARDAACMPATDYQDATGESLLIACLQKDDYSIQLACLALADIRSEKAIPEIAGVLDRNGWTTCRRMAADALVNMRSPQAVPYLEKLLNDRDECIRAKAEKALGKKGAPAATAAAPVKTVAPKAYADKVVMVDMSGACNQSADCPLEPERQGRQGDVVKAKILAACPAAQWRCAACRSPWRPRVAK
jgi:HEAT repeat protein